MKNKLAKKGSVPINLNNKKGRRRFNLQVQHYCYFSIISFLLGNIHKHDTGKNKNCRNNPSPAARFLEVKHTNQCSKNY